MKKLCKLKKKDPKKYKDKIIFFSKDASFYCSKCDRKSSEKKVLCKPKKIKK